MSEDSEFSDDLSGGWIQWFCSLEDHFYFCEVDHSFFRDPFNLFGFKALVQNFDKALEMILRPLPPEDTELEDEQFLQVYQEATDLYGLAHARFILTSKGLHLMREKYLQGKFGTCPRVFCEKQNQLPIGTSEELKTARVKLYCPRCQEIYHPKVKSQ
jgi:casein kinase II subunit beta